MSRSIRCAAQNMCLFTWGTACHLNRFRNVLYMFQRSLEVYGAEPLLCQWCGPNGLGPMVWAQWCDPKMYTMVVEPEGESRLIFCACTDIKPGQELT